MPVFFKPQDGWAGDFIPFYWQGEYHLFYLKDYRDKIHYGEGTPWFHIGTRDFVHFTDYGEALPRGREDEQDLYVFTGSVIERNGVFHIFYTGHNPYFRKQGKPEQAVMHATSDDLITWTKDPKNPILFADPQYYEMHDWRDPFVFWNDEARTYWMLLAARTTQGPSNRRGVTALAISDDLMEWKISQPYWDPHLYYTHECPDVFHWGDWWYSVYSTFSVNHITHYRKSQDLMGVWTAPVCDSFDGRAYYAAKTTSDGRRHFAFGWCPTRTDDLDTGKWNWGGHLVVHEITQAEDGALHVHLPDEIKAHFINQLSVQFEPQIGHWLMKANSIRISSEGEFSWCRFAELSDSSLIETTMTYSDQTRECGIIVKADPTLDTYYKIQLEPGRNRIIFDRWPRPGDEPPIMERPVDLLPNAPVQLQVIVEDTIIVVYVNKQIAMSARAYESKGQSVGVFVSEGSAEFQETRVSAAS